MIPRLIRFSRFILFPTLLAALLSLSGCLYDYAPSGPVRDIDTWLLGQWSTTDKAGHQFSAVVTPYSSDHYRVEFEPQGQPPLEFDAWISRVDSFSILVLRSLDTGPTFGKFVIYHYELLKPGEAPPGGIGAKRIRLSDLRLDASARTMDSYDLRAAIRKALKNGTLLFPHDVVADLKANKTEIPGSAVWTKTGSVTIQGETF